MAESELPDRILLFDGVCNLCNASVNFIIDRDPQVRLHFAALQSEAGLAQLRKYALDQQDLDSMVFIEQGRAYTQSDAALRVSRYLTFPWSLGGIFLLIPRFFRNAIYAYIARHRYRWFGKQEQCRIPTPELRARFLDQSG